MLFGSLVGAAIQWAAAFGCYTLGRTRTARAFLFGTFAVLFVFMCPGVLMSGILAVQGLVLVVVGWTATALNARPRRFSVAALVGTLLVFGGYGLTLIPTIRERLELRRQYPFESLAVRLGYERRSDRPVGLGKSLADDAVTEAPASQRGDVSSKDMLTRMEHWLGEGNAMEVFRGRSHALEIIHASMVEQFIDAPGFGVGRMLRMTDPEKYAKIPALRTVSLPPNDCTDPQGTPPSGPAARAEAARRDQPPTPPLRSQLNAMHEQGLINFLNRMGWGYVKDRDHVAGFQAHHFRRVPQVPTAADAKWWDPFETAYQGEYSRGSGDEGISHDETWTVRQLELVSLLRHEEPCAYVSRELPRMDKLAEFGVRDLNSFERRALEQIQQGQDVVTLSEADRIQMLGSIRAARQCLKCHAVERGELLGAFSYVLAPTQPVREKRQRDNPLF